ncbi:cytochrome C assembly family protein [Hahella ganghwensis]|uniref:cytochrome C assembly family protein n=1 Tax=Hahella ganghwensis TaxID=286420 RepID=UPI000379DEBF|nr:cytochrome c biogenesis protein CcsA [Hahella ganghwensis]
MSAITLSIIAIIIYTTATTLQFAVYQGKIPQRPNIALLMGVLAVITHALGLWPHLSTPAGANFSVYNTLSGISLVISFIIIVFAISKPVHNLKLIIFPTSVAAIIVSINGSGPQLVVSMDQTGVLVHAAFSVVAYAVFCLAAIQAVLLYAQNRQLKSHLTGRLVKALPPLQTSEAILFEMIWTGFVLLTLAIASGALFVEDLFAQHLVHKTVLSVVSWALFLILLVGRKLWGWRGLLAAQITIAGFGILMLGFLGSKFVLEILLNKTP